MIFSPHSTPPIIKGHIKENGNIGLAKKFIPFFSKEALVNSTYIQTLTKVAYNLHLHFSLKKFIYLFIYIWLCWVLIAEQAFSSCGKWGYSPVAVGWLLTAVVCLVADHVF